MAVRTIRSQVLLPTLGLLIAGVLATAIVAAMIGSQREVQALRDRDASVLSVLQAASFPVNAAVVDRIAKLSGRSLAVWNGRTRRIDCASLPPGVSNDDPAVISAIERVAGELSRANASTVPENASVLERDADLKTEAVRSGPQILKSVVLGQTRFVVQAIQPSGQPGSVLLVFTAEDSLSAAKWAAMWPPLVIGTLTLSVLIPWLLALTHGWTTRLEQIRSTVAEIAAGQQTGGVSILVPASQNGAVLPVAEDNFAWDNSAELTFVDGPLDDTESGSGNLRAAASTGDELELLLRRVQELGSELTKLQTELLRTERERVVAQLSAGLAHQFRNAVAGASLAVQLHAEQCPSGKQSSLDVAMRQLQLMESGIRGMLSLTRRSDSPRTVFCLRNLILDALRLLEPVFEHQRIGLQHNLPETVCRVQGVRDGLLSAVLNLLHNAIDAAGPGGEIRVSLQEIGNEYEISVADNGPGPSPEMSTRMLQPFVTSKPEGVGLGLTIVLLVLNDHQAALQWLRELDSTVFRFRLSKVNEISGTIPDPASDAASNASPSAHFAAQPSSSAS